MLPPATHVLLVTHLPLIHILIIHEYTVSCNAEEFKVAFTWFFLKWQLPVKTGSGLICWSRHFTYIYHLATQQQVLLITGHCSHKLVTNLFKQEVTIYYIITIDNIKAHHYYCIKIRIIRTNQFGLGHITREAVDVQVSKQLQGHLTYFFPGGGSVMG